MHTLINTTLVMFGVRTCKNVTLSSAEHCLSLVHSRVSDDPLNQHQLALALSRVKHGCSKRAQSIDRVCNMCSRLQASICWLQICCKRCRQAFHCVVPNSMRTLSRAVLRVYMLATRALGRNYLLAVHCFCMHLSISFRSKHILDRLSRPSQVWSEQSSVSSKFSPS